MPLSLFSKMGNSRSAPSTPVIATRDGKIQGKRLVDEPNFKADAYLVSDFVSTFNVAFERFSGGKWEFLFTDPRRENERCKADED